MKKGCLVTGIIGVMFLALVCYMVATDDQAQQTPQVAEASKSDIKGFDTIEPDYLRLLSDVHIKPKVEIKGNSKIFSTKFALLTIENYPSTQKATGMMMPSSDTTDNVDSMGIIGLYLRAITKDNGVGPAFMKAVENALQGRHQTFKAGAWQVNITPADKKAAIPMLLFEIVSK